MVINSSLARTRCAAVVVQRRVDVTIFFCLAILLSLLSITLPTYARYFFGRRVHLSVAALYQSQRSASHSSLFQPDISLFPLTMASSGAKKKGGIGIRGPEHLSLGGLRADGRLPAETRTMAISLGVLPHADGSAAIRQGNTWVLASVSGPHDGRGGGGSGGAGGGSGGGTTTTATGIPQGAHTEDAGLVRCTVTTARFSTPAGRKPSVRSGGDIADAVASTFTAVALTGLFGRSTVDVHVQVLVDDGCVRSAAINATAAALADAGVAMADLVAGCGVAFVGGVPLVDPTAAEAAGGEGGGGLTAVVAVGSGDVVSADVDGKLASVGVLAEGLDAAGVGAEQAAFAMREALRKYTLGLIDARGHVAF